MCFFGRSPLVLTTVLAIACFVGCSAQPPATNAGGGSTDATTERRDSDANNCRLIVSYDANSMWGLQLTRANRDKNLDADAVKAFLEEVVDEHAKAKVDRIVHSIFGMPWGTAPPGFESFYRQPEHWWYRCDNKTDSGIQGFEEAGYDLVQVLLDRSRKDGIQFIGGLRMNDRHGGIEKRLFCTEHPQWQLTGFRGGMDYKHEGVRNAVLSFVEEFLQRYDVDGIELDWMRWCQMFKPSEAQKNAPLLTDFIIQMRKLVDDAAEKRGRGKLLLGVRIPQTLAECRMLGFDVKVWVQQGRVDYICPSDFAVMDTNIRTEDFVALTKGTACKVYPSVIPIIRWGNDTHTHSAENYRAAANNFYAFGADGISAYNYQYHWRGDRGPEDEWPRALGYLTALRERKAIGSGERRYMYYPLSLVGRLPRQYITGVVKNDRIEILRGCTVPMGSMVLRIAEDLKDPHLSAMLEFKALGLVEADELEISLNGEIVPAAGIRRDFVADGQPAAQGRELPAFHRYRVDLGNPPLKFGDNRLTVYLLNSAGEENIDVQEIEILVREKN